MKKFCNLELLQCAANFTPGLAACALGNALDHQGQHTDFDMGFYPAGEQWYIGVIFIWVRLSDRKQRSMTISPL